MQIKTQLIEYYEGSTSLLGMAAMPENNDVVRPGILVAPDWSGRNDFAAEKAHELAELGYIAFALDMYGAGRTGKTKEEKSELIKPLLDDRALLLRRMLAAFAMLKSLSGVDPDKTGAIGFCFGGLCVLDLARSGADITGVVSFHGLLDASPFPIQKIKASVLALHGFDDPMVTPDKVMQFGSEMTESHANWQLNMYGHTMHGFTNPLANDPEFGTVYHPAVAKRAYTSMQLFFKEIFSGFST